MVWAVRHSYSTTLTVLPLQYYPYSTTLTVLPLHYYPYSTTHAIPLTHHTYTAMPLTHHTYSHSFCHRVYHNALTSLLRRPLPPTLRDFWHCSTRRRSCRGTSDPTPASWASFSLTTARRRRAGHGFAEVKEAEAGGGGWMLSLRSCISRRT
jgi:hypothetical protein